MKKKSSLIFAPALHAAQNAVTRKRFLKPRKEYLQSFMEGVTGKAHKTKAKNFSEGVISGTISPEYGEINKRMSELGKIMKDSKAPLDKRSLVKLRTAARGKIDAKGTVDVKNIINSMDPKVKKQISSTVGADIGRVSKINAGNVAKAINETPSLRVFDSLFDKLPKQVKNTDLVKNRKYNRAGKVTGLGTTTAVDPIAGAMNAKKLFLASDHAAKVPGLKNVQGKARELFVSNPIKREFSKGLKGSSRGRLSKFTDEVIYSPALRDAKDLSNSLGGAFQ